MRFQEGYVLCWLNMEYKNVLLEILELVLIFFKI